MREDLVIGNIEIKYNDDELSKENFIKFIIQYLVDKEFIRGDEFDSE
jgi:mannitol/fructose-specific phosphotransferase system IIA component (Ntr-type)